MRSTADTLGTGLGDLDLGEIGVPRGTEGRLQQAERELLIAILEDAIRTYQKYAFSGTRRGRRLFREVHAWFTEPASADVPVSYDYLCDVLDLEPETIRARLEHWRIHAFAGEGAAARTAGAGGGGKPPWWRNAASTRVRSRQRTVPSLLRVVAARV